MPDAQTVYPDGFDASVALGLAWYGNVSDAVYDDIDLETDESPIYSDDIEYIAGQTVPVSGIPSAEAFGSTVAQRMLPEIPNTSPPGIEGPLGEITFDGTHYVLLEGTDLGSPLLTADELTTIQREIDLLSPSSFNRLRSIMLKVRVFGDDFDDLMANIEYLQRFVTSGEEFIFTISPSGQSTMRFHIKRCPSFAVPYVRSMATHHRADVMVELEAEPYIYGEETSVAASNVTTPDYAALTIDQTFDTDMNLTVHSDNGITMAFVSFIEEGQLMKELNFQQCTINQETTLSGMRSTKVLQGKGTDHDDEWAWACVTYTCGWDLPVGGYHVFARISDRTAGTKVPIKLSLTKGSGQFPTGTPGHHFKACFTGSEAYGWAWIHLGPYVQQEGGYLNFWMKGTSTQYVDSLLFIPKAIGTMAWNLGRWMNDEGVAMGTCTDMKYENQHYYYDNLISKKGTMGSGFALPKTTTLNIIVLASNDSSVNQSSTSWPVDVSYEYTPRYATIEIV